MLTIKKYIILSSVFLGLWNIYVNMKISNLELWLKWALAYCYCIYFFSSSTYFILLYTPSWKHIFQGHSVEVLCMLQFNNQHLLRAKKNFFPAVEGHKGLSLPAAPSKPLSHHHYAISIWGCKIELHWSPFHRLLIGAKLNHVFNCIAHFLARSK